MVEEHSFQGVSGDIDNSFLPELKDEKDWSILKTFIKKKKTQFKPWTEFMNFKMFAKPKDVGQAGQRIAKNLDTYQTNYAAICLILVLYCM